MPSKNKDVIRAAQRRHRRSKKSRAVDEAVRQAACSLKPKSRCVVYYRSGLPRDAQQWAVEHLVAVAGARIIAAYEEAEDRDHKRLRPQLRAAIKKCQEPPGAALIIAALGQTQTIKFFSPLAESRVPFVCCDKPEVNHDTVDAVAARAWHSGRKLGASRKKAIVEAKAAGTWKGQPFPPGAQRRSREALRSRIKQHALVALAFIDRARQLGYRTNVEIARVLNDRNSRTVFGKLWDGVAIARLERWRTDKQAPDMLRVAAEAALPIATVEKSKLLGASTSVNGDLMMAEVVGPQPPKKKKRGSRPPKKRQAIIDRMRAEISEGTLTAKGLADVKEEALASKYGVSRHTVRDARNEVLSPSP